MSKNSAVNVINNNRIGIINYCRKEKGKHHPKHPVTLTFQHAGTRHYTSPFCMFFMLKPSLPFFPFLFFFFLQQHFLIIQKQQVSMSSAATTAMAIRAHGGTVRFKTTEAKLGLKQNSLFVK